MLKSVRIQVIATALIGSLVSVAHAADAMKQISVPAGDLLAAIETLQQQSDVQVVYNDADLKGINTSGVNGTLTIQEAVKKLLEGTTLRVSMDDATGAMMILGKNGKASLRRTSALERQHGIQMAEAADEGPEKLEEIVVTATKRKESIQDVPLSITAVTAEEINRRGLVSAEDYLRGIPGVNQVTEKFGASIVIRGIETSPSDQNFSSGTTVATYFGETPTTNSAGLTGGTNVDIKLVDIERVEVLRGPQGTAFGNSSLGGAVRTIPVAPRLDRFEGRAAASYSMTAGTGNDNSMIQAIGNLPLIQDKLALRATAYQFEDSGFYRNVAGSDPDFQALAAAFGAQAFASNDDEVGSSNFTGGRIAGLFQATDDLKFTLSYLTQKTQLDGQANASTSGYDQAMYRVAPQQVIRGEAAGVSDTDIDIANATMEYAFNWGSLLATYSHLESGSKYAQPLDPFVLPYSIFGASDHRENSGEVRVTTQLSGAWNFLAGVYAEELQDDGHFDIYWYGSPETEQSIFNLPDAFLGDYVDARNLKQKAAFGEASWKFLPRFTLAGGARAYDYERTGHVDTSLFSGGTVTTTNADADASGTSFRGNLSYKPNDNALLYAGWSQGFRLGTPQPGLPPGVCDGNGDGIVDGTDNLMIEQTKSVEADEVDNYELGAKLTLLNRRLTIAADVYRMDWTGVPVRTTALCAGAAQFAYNANAGAARSEGIEVQANFRVTEALRIDVGGSSMRAELTEDAPNLLVPAFEGDRLPGSPKFNANLALQYEFNIAGYDAFVRADSTYVGTFYGDFQQSDRTEAGGYLKLDASARVTIKSLNIDLFVRNLTNADDFTFRGTGAITGVEGFGYRLRPRTVGLQLGYQF